MCKTSKKKINAFLNANRQYIEILHPEDDKSMKERKSRRGKTCIGDVVKLSTLMGSK